MARTRQFTVHLRTWSTAPDREARFVREGFCWAAAVFSVFWALYHRLWFAALMLAAIAAALALAQEFPDIDPLLVELAGVGVSLIFGFEANDIRRRALTRRGFAEAAIVSAASLGEAEQRFFDRHVAATAT
jgi:hypothetical protein